MNEYIKARVADGYTYADKLIVPTCPLCGGVHVHTNRKGYIDGDRTTRVPHCHRHNGNGTEADIIVIRVRGELQAKKVRWLLKKKRYGITNKVRKVSTMRIPADMIGRE